MGQQTLLESNPLLARSICNRFPYLDPLNHSKRSVRAPVQAVARVVSAGCQFQGRSSAIRRAGWSAMRVSKSAR
jgi:hypothetical protein